VTSSGGETSKGARKSIDNDLSIAESKSADDSKQKEYASRKSHDAVRRRNVDAKKSDNVKMNGEDGK
jgi:hypothetical protein